MIRPREPRDLPAVEALLAAAGLPADGLDHTAGWVAEAEGRVVGHVAVESAPDAGVIRSLVVAPILRGGGRGRELLDAAEAAVTQGPIVLKTDTIAAWVERRGYRPVPLGHVPPGVRTTTQFEGALCAGTPVFLKERT
ncbi:MAG TPA: GNAT family N-acetyltransferase [Holophagaceae bacterium]|nr:GNAT family N-acetyltransferase [Holophagaceae bacterium]